MSPKDRKKVRTRGTASREISFGRQIFKGILRLIFIALVFVLVWYITRLQIFTLQEITVEGGETISHDEVRAQVIDELNGTYFLIIPKRFIYLYPHDRIMEVLEKVPRAHTIVVTRSAGNTLSVSFKEYIPHALWCLQENKNMPCLFLDKTGFAFAEAPLLRGGSFVRHSVEGVDELKPREMFPEHNLNDLDVFIERAESELQLRVTSLFHKKNGDIELSVNGGGVILISKGRNYQVTFDNLKSVLTSKEFKHIEPGNFNYVDVRFENKVFVNEEMSTSTASTTSGSVPSAGTTTKKLPE